MRVGTMEVESNTIPWKLYSLKLVMALAIIVSGMSSQGDPLGIARQIFYYGFYCAWAVSTLFFVWLNLEPTRSFLSHSLLYVAGIVGVFYFTFGVLKAESTTIPIFIPICFDMGIFLTMGFKYAWLSAKDFTEQHFALSIAYIKQQYRSTKVALRAFERGALEDSGNQQPLHPITNPTNPTDSDYAPAGTAAGYSGGSDEDESLQPTEDGHTAESFPPPPSPWSP